jgi:hypothetical protein
LGGSRRSRGYHRRQEEARERRRQRLIMLGAGGVLAVVAVVLLIGVVVTSVLPPRATVAEVGDRSFSARDLSDRSITAFRLGAAGLATFDATSISQLIDRSLDALIREEILVQVGEPIVGAPTQEEIQEQARERLGFPEEMTEEEFATAYREVLIGAGVSRADFEWIRRAEITTDRLREHFDAEIPEAGPQVRYYTVASRDRSVLDELRERMLEGEAFAELLIDLELAEDPEELDSGWQAEEALPQRLQMALEGADAGDPSAVQQPPGLLDFELYVVAERDAEREYEESMREQLQQVRLNDFLEEQREVIGVRVDLSGRERNWIDRQIQNALSG